MELIGENIMGISWEYHGNIVLPFEKLLVKQPFHGGLSSGSHGKPCEENRNLVEIMGYRTGSMGGL